MKRSYGTYSTLALALALALGGCSTWQHTSRTEKGTAVGATGGALVGAAVGGPVGAVVGAGVGGYAGHYETQPGGLAAANGPLTRYGEHGGNGTRYSQNSDEIRSVQQALNDQGYNAGPADGVMGPSTEEALRRFQQAKNLPQTGQPDGRTLAALGVSSQASYQANQTNGSNRSYQVSSGSNPPSQTNDSRRMSNRASNEDENRPQAKASSNASTSSNEPMANSEGSERIRSVQQALNDQGYNAGAVDGIMGPHTQKALRQFQQAQHLRPTGRADARTLAALGVSNQPSNQASNESNQPSNQAANESNQPSNQAANESNEASESNQASDQGSNQAANLPGQASNQAGNEASQSNESSTTSGSNQTSNQQR